jgi:hypothetical protein
MRHDGIGACATMLGLDIKPPMIHDNIRDNFGRKPRLLQISKTIDRKRLRCKNPLLVPREAGPGTLQPFFHVRNRAVEILKIFVGFPLSDS